MGRRLTPEERERRWMWRGVVRIANSWEGQRRSNQRALQAFGPAAKMELLLSNTAAGPCVACLAYADRALPIADVPLMPLVDCAQPDQCGCLWKLLFDIDNTPEPTLADYSLAARLIGRMFGN